MTRSGRWHFAYLVSLLLTASVWAQGVATSAPPSAPAAKPLADRAERRSRKTPVEQSVASGCAYLLKQIGTDGVCKTEWPVKDARYGSQTMVAIYALLKAGVDYRSTPALKRAVHWALTAELDGVLSNAYRVEVLAALQDDRAKPLLAKETKWLIRAASASGQYGPKPAKDGTVARYDNITTATALFAIHDASTRGVAVPLSFWTRMRDHFLAEQQPDGGWGFRTHLRNAKPFAYTYGSATAAGTAAVRICLDELGRKQYIHCKPSGNEAAIETGMAWLTKHLDIQQHPNKGVERYYQWMYMLSRLGEMTGRRHMGGTDWFSRGQAELIRRQHPDGSWSYGPHRTGATSLAVLFLSRGTGGAFLSKLQYPGRWNSRPRDADHVTGHLSYTFERPLSWQVVDIDSLPASDDEERKAAGTGFGRIVYLSGAGPMNLTDTQITKLRRFVDRGGMILSESACDRAAFTLDIHRAAQRLFGRYRLLPLSPESPVFTAQFKDVKPTELLAIHNGIRPLWIHSPRQLSLAWQMGPAEANRPTFDLMGNLFLMLTDMGSASPDVPIVVPATPKTTESDAPRRVAELAILSHSGDAQPEPQAWRNLARLLKRDYDVTLRLTRNLPPRGLDPLRHPVAYLTGATSFTLSKTDRKAIADYIARGGTLIVEAAGGSKAFNQSARDQLLDGLGTQVQLPLDHAIYTGGPSQIGRVRFRRSLHNKLYKEARYRPRLRAIYFGQRPGVIYSPEDLTAGLVGYPIKGMEGYVPRDARRLMVNLLFHLNGLQKPSTP